MTDVWYCEPPPPCYTPDPCYVPDPCYEPPPPPCYEPPAAKGNNGWGNGIDGANPGTPHGNEQAAGSKMNLDGFEWSKFTGR